MGLINVVAGMGWLEICRKGAGQRQIIGNSKL